jgi:hypothetical protein
MCLLDSNPLDLERTEAMTGLVKAMRGVKYAMLGLGVLSVLLCLLYNVFQYGGHGVLLFAVCLVPTALAGLSIKLGGMPRWASAVSLVSFLIAGMKTSGGSSSLQNIMVAVFFAMLAALALLILPDRPKKQKSAPVPAGYAAPPAGYAAPPAGYAAPPPGRLNGP